MPVFRWGHSWDPLRDLEREVDRLLRGVNLTVQGIRVGRQFPALNLYELPDEYLMTAELPGVKVEDLELTVVGGILTLRGDRKTPNGIDDDRYRRRERFRGAWQRSVTLPERVREELLTADFTNGILKIHLPKADELKPRQIPVAEGGE